MPETEQPYRLPRTVVPSRYDLTLEPDLDTGTFDGAIEVALEVVEPVTEIVLNANELRLDDATLTAADGSRSRCRRSSPMTRPNARPSISPRRPSRGNGASRSRSGAS